MCEWGQRTECFVNTPANLSNTGDDYWSFKAVDSCLSDIVDALNKAGILTSNCCCGHGKRQGTIILQDGRELKIKGEAWKK